MELRVSMGYPAGATQSGGDCGLCFCHLRLVFRFPAQHLSLSNTSTLVISSVSTQIQGFGLCNPNSYKKKKSNNLFCRESIDTENKHTNKQKASSRFTQGFGFVGSPPTVPTPGHALILIKGTKSPGLHSKRAQGHSAELVSLGLG